MCCVKKRDKLIKFCIYIYIHNTSFTVLFHLFKRSRDAMLLCIVIGLIYGSFISAKQFLTLNSQFLHNDLKVGHICLKITRVRLKKLYFVKTITISFKIVF